MRVVSLLPSATEILHALGAGPQMVGVTFECDSPSHARTDARVVSTSSLPEGLTPAEIDAAVRDRLAAGEDLYRLDRDALAGLDPDVVITQDLCAVCAVDLSEVDDALVHLGCRADVVTTDPHTLEQVWQSVEQIGAAVDRVEAARSLADSLRRRVAAVARAVATRPRPRVVVLEWTDPPFAPGHWVPEMVEVAGGLSVLGETGARSRATDWDAVRQATPDVVVVAPCGFGLEESARLGRELLASRVLPEAAVWAVDANASFARPGPRLADGVEALAALLHGQEPDPVMARRLH